MRINQVANTTLPTSNGENPMSDNSFGTRIYSITNIPFNNDVKKPTNNLFLSENVCTKVKGNTKKH